ncbi:MAG: hypothetical protein QM677_07085 [Microbacterium sp.]
MRGEGGLRSAFRGAELGGCRRLRTISPEGSETGDILRRWCYADALEGGAELTRLVNDRECVAQVAQMGPLDRSYLDPYPSGVIPGIVMRRIEAGIRLVAAL